jgi:hypothetical protein
LWCEVIVKVGIAHGGDDNMSENPPLSAHVVGEEEKEFLHQLGGAITDWAAIDERLFNICVAVLKTNKRLSAVIYYRNNTLGSRLVLVDELLKVTFPKANPNGGHDHSLIVTWSKLYKEINDELNVRNRLAHSTAGPMVTTSDNPDGSFSITDIWWGSYVGHSETLRKGTTPPELKLEHITRHRQSVARFFMELWDFQHTLETHLAK